MKLRHSLRKFQVTHLRFDMIILYIVEPRYNEGPRDWQNWLSIPRFRYTVEPRYNEPQDNEDLSITNDFVYPNNSKN